MLQGAAADCNSAEATHAWFDSKIAHHLKSMAYGWFARTSRPSKPKVLHISLHNLLGTLLDSMAIPVHFLHMAIKKRGNIYQLVQRVPRRYQPVEARETVWISLHTDSETAAKVKAPLAWAQMIEAWDARLAGDSPDAESRLEAAKELAAMRGFRYLPAARVAKLPREELLQRIEAVQTSGDAPVKTEAAAILGIVAEPAITVSRALELFWTLAKAKTLGKSEAQVKKWKSPIKQAIRDFIAVIGDKALHEITRDDVRSFRDWWLERIETEDLNPSNVNKNMDHFGKVLKLVNCSIPEHCIDPRRLPLFIARSALRDLIAGLQADAKGVQAV